MKRIGLMMVAVMTFSSSVWADTTEEAPKTKQAIAASTKDVNASSVEAAKKRSESTVIRVEGAEEKSSSEKTETNPLLLVGKFPTVASTKVDANAKAGNASEVHAPTAAAITATVAPSPALVRGMAALRPKFQGCVSHPSSSVVMKVTVSASGEISGEVTSGVEKTDEAACLARAVSAAKIRGARGTSALVQLPL